MGFAKPVDRAVGPKADGTPEESGACGLTVPTILGVVVDEGAPGAGPGVTLLLAVVRAVAPCATCPPARASAWYLRRAAKTKESTRRKDCTQGTEGLRKVGKI